MSRQTLLIEAMRQAKSNSYIIPRLTTGNSKLKADKIAAFTLPAGITCPGSGVCNSERGCYAMHGPMAWPDSIKKQVENFEASKRDDFVFQMIHAIAQVLGRFRYIRIHDAGDFYSQSYISSWEKIIDHFQGAPIQFYAYTKSFADERLDLSGLWLLPNLNLIQSVGSRDDSRLDITKPHARIFPNREALEESEYIDCDESDLPAAMGHRLIGLVAHGLKKKVFQ